jgi:phospholipase/carboxylesterase
MSLCRIFRIPASAIDNCRPDAVEFRYSNLGNFHRLPYYLIICLREGPSDMPRTQRSVPTYSIPETNLDAAFQLESASISTGHLDFDHALFAPLHYTPGYAYPLIVWLHGEGADERQLQRIMPMVSMQNFLAVSPRGFRVGTAEEAQSMRHGWSQDSDAIQRAEQRVFECIEVAQRKFHVASHRIFLAGFDTGGTMALRLAMSHPQQFAGVLSLCGAFPTGGKPFGNLIAARRLFVLLATGRNSADYPADRVCEDLRLLHSAGLSVTLRQYPCGHELSPLMLADVNRWIMEQITAPGNSVVESDIEWLHETE